MAQRLEHHQQSLLCAGAKPNDLLASSQALGWRSMLVDHHEGVGQSDVFETHPTPDITLVVAVRGRHRIEVLSRQQWRSADYGVGAAGLTPGLETTRMRWSSMPGREPFQTAHLYLPGVLMAALADEYRRAGTSIGDQPLSALIFNDPVIASAAAALLDAMTSEAPDLYAEQVARWLAAHLLGNHSSWWKASEDRRQAAVITDRRLARVVEYMSAHLAEPMTMEALAREAGISVHHFGRRFREQTGVTPFGFLSALRMKAAERHLLHSGLTIAEIAHTCGYARPAAFAAAFLRHSGSTPTDFRTKSQTAGAPSSRNR